MSIVATDLVVYGAANQAEADGVTQGGAIQTNTRYVFGDAALVNDPTASGGNGTTKIVSSNAGDTTQTVTVTGRNAGGSIVSDVINLNGTNVIAGVVTFERILKVVVSGAHAGTVTLGDSTNGAGMGNTIVDIETGVLTVRVPFYNVAADASGGSSRDFYEKVFVKNNHGTLSLLTAMIKENADPTGNITFDLEDAVDDNNSIASRLNTPPTGMQGTFTNADKTVPGTDLAAGSAIGVWLKLTLAAGAAAAKSTWTMRVEGQTT